MTLNDFNEHFDTELESDDVDTILELLFDWCRSFQLKEVKEHYAVIQQDKHLNLSMIRLGGQYETFR